jgi:hypothetical protein
MVLECIDVKQGLRLASGKMDGKMDMGRIKKFPIRLSSEVQFIFLWEN